jgi:DNA-binding HxlR family transcriptional regulator
MSGTPRGSYAIGQRDDRLVLALAERGGKARQLLVRMTAAHGTQWVSEKALKRTLGKLVQSGHVVAFREVGRKEAWYALSGAGRDWADALRELRGAGAP